MLDKTFTFAYNKGGNITAKREYAYTTGTPSVLLNEYEYGYENTYSDLLTYLKINGVQQDLFYDQMAHPLEHNGNPLSWAMGKLATYGTTAFNYSYDNTRLYKGTDYETVL
ncbi:MAG: hypothetical protein IKD43_02535, partial [Clostridia bacterium]|nr:hypothetical protein [Clostridia bacterium]